MAEFLDRVMRVVDVVLRFLAKARTYIPVIAPYFYTFGRTVALLIAGLVITFIQNHGNIVGLWWLEFVSIVSLAVRDDRSSSLTRALWWVNVLFTGASLFGLVFGTISAVSALSLAISLALFECARGFVRKDLFFGWASAALALVMTVLVPITGKDSTMAAGSIGAWAIVLGVFGAIAQSDVLLKKGKEAIRRVTKR